MRLTRLFFPFAVWLSVSTFPAAAQQANVTYRVDSNWTTGLQAALTIKNTGSTTLRGWTLSFDYAHNITSIWEAQIQSRSGTRYTISGPAWNRDLPPGGQAWVGWVAALAGAAQPPSGCTMPGVTVTSATCPGGSAGDSTAPSVPGNLRSPAQTPTTITLEWNASTDNAGGSGVAAYDIRQGTTVIGSVAHTSFVAQGLTPGTTYSFSIRARDRAGNASAYSRALRVGTVPPLPCTQLPAVPTGLAVAGVTANSAQIRWSAVPPSPGCTVTYRIWLNGVMLPGAITDTSHLASGLTPSTSYTVAVSAVNQAGASAASPAVSFRTADAPPPPISTFPPRVFAPYTDVLLWPTPNFAAISQQTGVKYFTAAFVTSGGGCQASWGGVIPATQSFLTAEVEQLRALGGDVIVSFGGAFGIELGQACTSVASLQGQYQYVIDKFGLTRVDFDIEGASIADTASIDRRNKAIAGLQAAARAAGRPLTVQFTLPVLPTGLTSDGVNLLRNAVQNGVEIGVVNVMAMDYGNAVADPYAMGQNAVNAVNATFAQMKAVYGPAKTDAQLRAMQGVTPMIGLNDVVPEVFTLQDASLLLSFAGNNRLGLVSMWSTGRDRPCAGTPHVSPVCSGIAQADYAFSKLFFPYSGQ